MRQFSTLLLTFLLAFCFVTMEPASASQTQQKKTNKKRSQKRRRRPVLPKGVVAKRNIEYAKIGDKSLKLDLYLPPKAETKPPLLVWIHGGGWRAGSKNRVYPVLLRLTGEGYAVASVEYRLNGLKNHPEHTHDCKGAIRWLRANATKYGYNADRIGVSGGSAGGHIVLMLGMTSGIKELEGKVGGNLEQSSRVQAVANLYGVTDFAEFAKKNGSFKTNDKKIIKLYESASPLSYLSKDDAPVITFHGNKDRLVPVEQADLLHSGYQKLGLKSELHIIDGAGHGGRKFSDSERFKLVKEFFDRHIKQ